MIRAEAGAALSKFLSVSFLELMSHFCDTDIIAPCREAKCELTEEEWNAIPEWFAEDMMGYGLSAFDEVGGIDYGAFEEKIDSTGYGWHSAHLGQEDPA